MLELYILKYLMLKENQSFQEEGRLRGWSVSHIQQEKDIPKSTFYRALRALIKMGIVYKQKRNSYLISDGFRAKCNDMKDCLKVST